MKIAVEGCMHGDLDNVYATLLHLQEIEKTKIDLLICCGDFQVSWIIGMIIVPMVIVLPLIFIQVFHNCAMIRLVFFY